MEIIISKEEKKKKKVLHCWKPDPHEGKEDNRPIEKRKKPKTSIMWSKLKRLLEIED